MVETLTKYSISFDTDYCSKEINIPVIYDPEYLQTNVLDLNLAKLCCILCCCSYKEKNIRNAFKTMEFDKIKSFYFPPKENTASLCVAEKGNNIFVVIRGTQGEEWYNNFRTGIEDIHQGYYDTVDFIMPLIKEYANSPKNIVFTGHSRGGALSNLIASQLISNGRQNVYAYTFACPNNTARDDVYSKKFKNIHNFVYEEDIITQCPLKEWGYNRYGSTINFKIEEINYNKLKKEFNRLTGMNFVSFRDCNESVESFTETALRLASNPYEYYNKGYLVDEDYLTLYDYFQIICDIFNDKDRFNAGITLLATKLSDFAPISNFLASGIEITDITSQKNTNTSCSMIAHSCLTYLCLLNTQKIKGI